MRMDFRTAGSAGSFEEDGADRAALASDPSVTRHMVGSADVPVFRL